MFFTKLKIATIDKRILKALKTSNWYRENKSIDKYSLRLKNVDSSEQWVREVFELIKYVWGKKKYRSLFVANDLQQKDLMNIYVFMTFATMPNPLFKTGPSNMSYNLVGTAIYQEYKLLESLIDVLKDPGFDSDNEKHGLDYAGQVMVFATFLKQNHELRYGKITFDDVF